MIHHVPRHYFHCLSFLLDDRQISMQNEVDTVSAIASFIIICRLLINPVADTFLCVIGTYSVVTCILEISTISPSHRLSLSHFKLIRFTQ